LLREYIHITCTKTTTENPLKLLWCKGVWAQVLEDCAEPEKLSSPWGKHGNTDLWWSIKSNEWVSGWWRADLSS